MRVRPRWLGRPRDGERGQAMIEMALLLPFVFLLMLLSIEFGFMLWTDINVEAAAHEAARAAALGKPPGLAAAPPTTPNCEGTDTVRGRAVAASAGRVQCNEVVIWNVERAGSTAAVGTGDGIIVDIQHQYTPFTPGLAILNVDGIDPVTGAITIRGCADARVELPGPPTSVKTDLCP